VRPLTSHNAATHNIILKVIVPKRTGRKRKRGSDVPFEHHDGSPGQQDGVQQDIVQDVPANGNSGHENPVQPPPISSHSHLDTPSLLRRKLRDTIGAYTLEPIGVVHNTHRYRGLSDFQYSMGNSHFMNRFVDQVMPGSIPKLRQFEIEVGTAQAPDIDLVPPPFFAPQGMPNAYNYSQNPFVRKLGSDGFVEDEPERRPVRDEGEESEDDDNDDDAESRFSEEFDRVVNTSMRGPAPGYFIRYNEFPSPMRPRVPPDLSDPHVKAVMDELRRAMNERPVWTRRSMFNRLSSAVSSLPKSGNIIKHCIQYAGYQFRGGPWRDSLVRYGVDPRSDPKYRVYQTLIFKLHKRRVGNVGGSWQSVRRKEVSTLSGSFGRYWKDSVEAAAEEEGGGRAREHHHRSQRGCVGHVFDGTSFNTDGKVWQVCDITDPLLAKLFADAEPLAECDFEKSGWYPPVLWFVAKAIMKRKMLAIRFKRDLPDAAFGPALKIVRDAAASDVPVENINVPLPDLGLTTEEREQIRGRKVKSGRKGGRDRADKNMNAPLRIRQQKPGHMREVRFVEYPDGKRYQVVGVGAEHSGTPGREENVSVEGGGKEEVVAGEGEGEEERVAEVLEKEETLRDLIESDEEEEEDDEDDDESDEEEGEEEELEEEEDEESEEDDLEDDVGDEYDSGDEMEELDEQSIQWRI
jgi:general transcription factor 3C polypeptide 5 (transcription factor C subunit 1)